MKKFNSILTILMLLFVTPQIAYSEKEEFEFKVIFDHDFDDDDERIECEIKYDDSDKTFKFDDNDKGDDLEYENDFTEDIKISCDEKVDEIRLIVTDKANQELYDEKFKDDKSINYDIETYQDDEDWFELELDHNFGSKSIDCELEVDSREYSYEFDENDNSKTLTIEKNFDNLIKFSCDEEIDEIKLKVYDDDGDEEFKKTYTEDDKISYDKEKEESDSTEITIDIDHDFDEKIECEIEIDEDETNKYEFDEDSSSSDLKIAVEIKEELKFECDED